MYTPNEPPYVEDEILNDLIKANWEEYSKLTEVFASTDYGIRALRLKTAFDTSGIATGVSMGTLPAEAIVLPHHVNITTAYNAATTNVLVVGTAADPDHYVAAGDVTETSIAFTANITTGCEEVSVITDVLVQFTESGTAATAGESTVILPYIQKYV